MKRFVGLFNGTAEPRLLSQPAPERYRCCYVLYSGYIANRTELMNLGRERESSLNISSDGQLFACAYLWWGTDLQARVLGEYSVAVYDSVRGTLLLTHDALGLRALFHTKIPRGLVFASHLDLLVSAVGIGDLDEDYLTDFLAWGRHPEQQTPYKGVFRLVAGKSLQWRNRQLTDLRTWNLGETLPLRYSSDSEYEERFRYLLGAGIKAALRSDGVVWSELSGGLDSSSVACMAAKEGSKLEVFSIIYSQSQTGDERKWMRAVVQKYGLTWHTFDLDSAPPFSEAPDDFYAEPNPVMLVASFYKQFQELLATFDVRVMLSGHGGDHIFIGDSPQPHYLADFLVSGHFNRLVCELRKWQANSEEHRSVLYFFLRNALTPAFCYLRRRTLKEGDPATLPPYIHPHLVQKFGCGRRSSGRHVADTAQ